jgi:4-amino-4-deoxy-L-arabinose transferase-like glycosyltransferase
VGVGGARKRGYAVAVALWLVAALVVRFLVAILGGAEPLATYYGDDFWHHATATHLATGRGYINPYTGTPTAEWPPGYAMILALVYRLLGPSPTGAFVLNAVASTTTAVLTWRLASTLGSPRGGVIAAAAIALLPSHVLFTGLVLSETVFATAVTLLVLVSISLVERDAGGG